MTEYSTFQIMILEIARRKKRFCKLVIGDNGLIYTYMWVFFDLEVKNNVCSKFKSIHNVSKCDFNPGRCSGQGQSLTVR